MKKTVEDDSDGDTSCIWCDRKSLQSIGTGTGGFGNKRTSGDRLNYRFLKIGQNTEKIPGEVMSLKLQIDTIG